MGRLGTLTGITEKQIERLVAEGVKDTKGLLKKGSTPDGRRDLAKATKINPQRIGDWVHRSDLVRVKGINDAFARLLVRAGVDSVVELSTQNPIDLAADLEVAEAIEQTGKKVPSKPVLQRWIEDARLLVRNVWYHDTWGDEERTGRPPAKYQGPRY
jgi:hypothetical protein